MASPRNRPIRIVSNGKPGIAGAVAGPTAKLVDAESPVEPVAVIV